ncbi:MAG: DUF2007 domain-containing protein [Pirellulales bacterium]|nr:DUF2007 domain-containing protein [Pirellulales bacterium]
MSGSDDLHVYRTASSAEARSLAAALAAEGIESRVVGEALQGAYAGLNIGGMSDVSVWIHSRDRERADGLIAGLHREAAVANATTGASATRGAMLGILTVLGLLGALVVLG